MVTEAKIKFNPSPRYNADGIPIRFGSSQDSRILYDGTNNEWTVQTKDAGGTFQDRFRIEANTNTPDVDLLSNPIKWTSGRAVTAGDYSISRDADGTNQLHLNVPTGAGFEWSINDASKMVLDSNGALIIGDTANAGMTIGVTVNQAANQDEVYAAKGSAVAHGRTGLGETDTFFALRQANPDFGGVELRAIMENAGSSYNLVFVADGGQASATKSTAARGLVDFMVRQHDGANASANITADGNVLSVRAHVGGADRTVFIVDEDGDLHVDGSTTLTAFDDLPDALVARAARAGLSPEDSPLRQEAAEYLKQFKSVLEERDVIRWNEDSDGVPFINLKAGLLFAWDGLYQAYQERRILDNKIVGINDRLLAAGLLPEGNNG